MADYVFPDKDPNDDLNGYAFNFSALLGDAETIEEATVTASPAGLTVSAVQIAGDSVTFRCEPGDVGRFTIVCEIVTSEPNTLNRKAKIRVRDL